MVHASPADLALGRMLSAHMGPWPARLQGWISSQSRNSLNHPSLVCFCPLRLKHSAVAVMVVKYLPHGRRDKCLLFASAQCDSDVTSKPAAGLNQEAEKEER